MKNIGKLLLVLMFGSLMTGCTINSSIMFKTKKDFISQPDRTIGNIEYKIALMTFWVVAFIPMMVLNWLTLQQIQIRLMNLRI